MHAGASAPTRARRTVTGFKTLLLGSFESPVPKHGELQVHIVPLEQAEAAQLAIQSGGLAGRIVLDCGGAN